MIYLFPDKSLVKKILIKLLKVISLKLKKVMIWSATMIQIGIQNKNQQKIGLNQKYIFLRVNKATMISILVSKWFYKKLGML